MPLIVGLGNPGQKYRGTRHNIGFEVIDRLADSLSITLTPGKGSYFSGRGKYKGQQVILAKPTTFMNRSGEAVSHAMNWFKLSPGECLVCYDDVDLPLGKIRLRARGSAGTHNGMNDIIYKLGTDELPRLRVGIGSDFREGQQSRYVLSKFPTEEREEINPAVDDARDAILCFIQEGIETAMNKFN